MVIFPVFPPAITTTQSPGTKPTSLTAQYKIKDLTEKASKGDAEAACDLADVFENGDGVPKDPTRAYACYLNAAGLGSIRGLEMSGWHEMNGEGTPYDPQKALESYRKATAMGSGYAAQQIGWMYQEGKGVPQDDAQAVIWYQRAVQQGEKDACGPLGWLTENGRGTPKDPAAAAKIYFIGAEAGDSVSQDNLGWLCVSGVGVTQKNYPLALKLFQQAAAQGNARAEGNLGYLFEKGLGVPADPNQALLWFIRSADHGDLKSQLHLGRSYLVNALGQRDPGRAIHYSLLAAQQGSEEGLMDLAVSISIVGDSVPENASAAFPFLKAKAEDQTELAFNPLGLCYLRGIGTPVNEAEARVWLMKSVKNPDLGGMLIPQCRMLTAGSNGYPRNPNLAMELLRAASEAGNTAAKIQLARMEPDAAKSLAELRSLSDGGNMQATYELGLRYQNGDRAPLNTKEALALFRASAAKGFSEAMYHLGILYQGGILVKRDETQAAAWYQKAKAAGNPFAAARLKPDGSLAPLATPPRVAPDTIVTTYTTVEPK